MTKEIYKDVVGYEGIYQVSNLGNVKRVLISNGVKKNHKNNNILIPNTDRTGYYRLGLRKNGKRKYFMLHRLVAYAFISNPKKYRCINHINGIKSDNTIENLEWCTHAYNNIHALKTGLRIHPTGDNNKLSKKIIDINTGEIYNSSLTLSKKLGINRGTLGCWLSNNRKNKTSFRYL
jgi:hypothetical protein